MSFIQLGKVVDVFKKIKDFDLNKYETLELIEMLFIDSQC